MSKNEQAYKEALKRMKQAPKDRIGKTGTAAATSLGMLGGYVAAPTAASIAGATTLVGSTKLAALLGGVLVTTTPVGWLVGGAVLGGAALFGATRLVGSGVKADEERRRSIREMEAKLPDLRAQRRSGSALEQVEPLLRELVSRGQLDAAKAAEVRRAVSNGTMPVDFALRTLQELLRDAGT
jgi:hypothetical protein